MIKPLLLLLAASILWGGSVEVSALHRESGAEQQELLYYPNGKFIDEACLGYSQAVAAMAWIRAVQYYGEHILRDGKFELMYHVCDIITTLDPRFEEAYVFGGFVLLTEGRRPEMGRNLLQKGMTNNPDSWKLAFEYGFVHYIAWKDYETASRYFQIAAEKPGAPEKVGRFAAFVSAKAGHIDAAIVLWQQVAESTGNPELRKRAEKKVKELLAEKAAGHS